MPEDPQSARLAVERFSLELSAMTSEQWASLAPAAVGSGTFSTAFDRLVMVKHLFDDGNLYGGQADGRRTDEPG